MTVLMDTNALMMPVECGVRVFAELDRLVGLAPSASDGDAAGPSASEDGRAVDSDAAENGSTEALVPEAVLDELAKLSDGAGEEATAAGVGLDLARERCRPLAHEADYADDAVVECAERPAVTHAVTNDGPLKRRLLDRGVPVISLRARNKLAVTQP